MAVDGGAPRQGHVLAVEDEPRHRKVRQEPLLCAKLTLRIDPGGTDSGVGGRLVEGFAQQPGAQIEWASGSKGTVMFLTFA